MKIIVCIKQVPDTSGKVAVNPDGTLNRASMQTITNPDDMNAVEAALKLKDETGCEVIVVTMGPPPAAGMLREAMAMGADRAVLVSAREFGGSDTYATSQILAAAISTIGVEEDDIVMCGRQAIDGDTAQVGPQIAEKLHLPQITYAADIAKEGKTVTVKRMLEDGYMTIKTQTPCLLTCIKELNAPRYMNMNGTRPLRFWLLPSPPSAWRRTISSCAAVKPSTAIPLRSVPRSLRSCTCPRSPTPLTLPRKARPSRSSVCWRTAI